MQIDGISYKNVEMSTPTSLCVVQMLHFAMIVRDTLKEGLEF